VTDTKRSTPEARVLDAGWRPRTSGLEGAIQRREALRSAIAELKTRGHADRAPIEAAIAEADRDGIVEAITRHAIGLWLDSVCQRPDTELYEWSAKAEQELLAAVYSNADVILASLPEGPDSDYLRAEAELSVASSLHVVGFNGQPARPRLGTPSMHRVLVAR
jgi:hypothetical protein